MSVGIQDTVYLVVFLGAPKQMSTSVLLTYTDVIKFYNLTKYEIKHEMNQKDPSHFAIATNVSKQIDFLWQKASIPISRKRIDYINIYRSICQTVCLLQLWLVGICHYLVHLSFLLSYLTSKHGGTFREMFLSQPLHVCGTQLEWTLSAIKATCFDH